MRIRDYFYRYYDRFALYFYSGSNRIRLSSRAIFFALLSVLLVLVSTAIADQMVSTPEAELEISQEPSPGQESIAPSDSETVTVQSEPVPTESSEPASVQPAPTAAGEPDVPTEPESPKPTEPPNYRLDNQPQFKVQMPASVAIDPRAKSYIFPRIGISGSEYLLVCFIGNGVQIDIGTPNQIDDRNEADIQILGDRSDFVLISASQNIVQAIINAGRGLIAFNSSKGISGKSISLGLVGLSAPSADPELCASAPRVRFTLFRALGLDVNTKSGGGALK